MGKENFGRGYSTSLSYEVYKREEFVKFMSLTSEEFFLLPERERLAIGELLYGDVVSLLSTPGDYFDSLGYIDAFMFDSYFERVGCATANYDFGVECCRIKKFAESTLDVDEEDIANALYHVNVLNEAKADAFEEMVIKSYPELAEALDNEEEVVLAKRAPEMVGVLKDIMDGSYFFAKWPEDVRPKVIRAALCAMMERLDRGEEVTIQNCCDFQAIFAEFDVKVQGDEHSLTLSPNKVAK